MLLSQVSKILVKGAFFALLVNSLQASADSVIVFNEINYHPADTAGETEWVELQNLMGVDVDISGWAIDEGIGFEFSEGTIIPGNGFFLVAADPNASSLSGRGALGPFSGRLSNSGESLRLVNRNGRVMDEITYEDGGEFPVGADGAGATLAKRDEGSAQGTFENWVASPAVGGTPGVANFPSSGDTPTVTEQILLGDEWRYRDDPTAPPIGWQNRNFNDSSWPTGDAGFHAGLDTDTEVGFGLLGYWPLEETSGLSAPNEVDGAPEASLNNGASWLTDPTRGQVLVFDGENDYANAGSIPLLDAEADFTWSFWAFNQQGTNSNVVLGNRRGPNGEDFSPREFIKFTTNKAEWHENGTSLSNIDIETIPAETWIHHAVVKDGTSLTYYRDGLASGSSLLSTGLNNPQPFYFGGDQEIENWAGRLDEPAIWERALPASAIAGLADGTFTPDTAPTRDVTGSNLLGTELADGTNTYYFRNTFDFAGDPSRTNLSIRLLVDDGAVVYLNGVEVHRENMPDGTIAHETFSETEVVGASLGAGITLSSSELLIGTNVIAIEIHQSSATDTDLLFDAQLTSTELPADPLASQAVIAFSEIESAIASNFRIELTNRGNSAVDLSGFVIQSSQGFSYTFPSGTLEAGSLLTVNSSTLGFRPEDGDRLSILRPGGNELLDARSVTNRLRGLDADGRWVFPTSASFGSSNIFNINPNIVINEIMYNPRPTRQAAQTTVDTLLDWGATWRFNESGEDLGDTWETSAHPVGGDWQSAPGPLGFEDEALPIPLATVISPPEGNTVYFETDLILSASQVASLQEIRLSHLVDDGAVFYLNGIEIPGTRFKMNPEPTSFNTRSNGGGEAVLIQGLVIPQELLLVGTNRISVEVHQTSLTSSDVVFGLRLDSVTVTPPIVDSNEQWLELYNRGDSTVNLENWEFTDGIRYTFPAGTNLGPGEYLILAADAVSLSVDLPGATILGDYNGNLSRSGETLTLRDSFGNIADEVTYYDGGGWPDEADGNGSSIELIDPRSDNNIAASWSFSDEAARSTWQSYSYRASGSNNGGDPTLYNEFLFGMLNDGEILIDDLSVIEDPDGAARQLLQNGDFSSGNTDSWRFIGNHRRAEVIADPDTGGGQVVHLIATGSTEHQHNNAGTTLKNGDTFVEIDDSLEYEISFRAKWLSGSNQFHSRLYFNRAARSTFLDVPEGGGSPGAANTRLVSNAGPSMEGLIHSPAVPAAGQSCIVSVEATDPDNVSTMTLFYSVDENSFESTPMVLQEEGAWTAVVPGQSFGSKVQFYIEAEDSLGATSFMPPAGPDSRAMIPFDDGQAIMDLGDCQPNNLRIVITDSDRDFLHEITNVMSNDRIPCTVIWKESEVYYGCAVRLKGSQRGRGVRSRVGFNIAFPAERPFLGAHERIAVDRSGSGGFSQSEILVKHAINHAGGGVPAPQDDLIRVIAPREEHTTSAILLKSRFDSEFLDNMYQDGNDGTAWEFEFIYFPTTTVGGDIEGLKIPNPDSLTRVGARSLGTDPELYRWHWLIKNNRDEDNFAPLIEVLADYGQPASPQYLADMDRLIDVDQFLRTFAAQVLFGVGDSYSSGSNHNAYFYQRPEDGRFLYLPWDMDFPFVGSAQSSLTASGDLRKLLSSPANTRAYYGHLQDIVTTTYNVNYMGYWTEHYSCFLDSQDLTNRNDYIQARGNFALSQVESVVPFTEFAVTTPDSSTSDSAFVVEGEGWVNVREIRLAGSSASLPITWVNTNTFQVSIPVNSGANFYTIEAFNFEGELIGTDTIEVTGVGDVIPASDDNLVITEIMFNPATSGPEDPDSYEFVELTNISPSSAVDLSGVAFTAGITYTFPPGSQLDAGEQLIVPRDLAAFQSRYGTNFNFSTEYQSADGSNRLANGGEEITLLDSLGNLISTFTYDDSSPWPASADGDGYSLELVNPFSIGRDPTLPINWRSSRSIEGNPGGNESTLLSDWMDENGISDPDLDPDEDGLTHALEFLFGTDPFLPDSPRFEARFEDGFFLMDVAIRNGADGIVKNGRASRELVDWFDAEYIGRLNNNDGQTSTMSFGLELLPNEPRGFLRIEVQLAP